MSIPDETGRSRDWEKACKWCMQRILTLITPREYVCTHTETVLTLCLCVTVNTCKTLVTSDRQRGGGWGGSSFLLLLSVMSALIFLRILILHRLLTVSGWNYARVVIRMGSRVGHKRRFQWWRAIVPLILVESCFQNILSYCIGRMEGEGCGVRGRRGQKNTQLGRRRKSPLPVPECWFNSLRFVPEDSSIYP